MDIEFIHSVLGWSALLNYLVLIVWFLISSMAHNWIYGLQYNNTHIKSERYKWIVFQESPQNVQ